MARWTQQCTEGKAHGVGVGHVWGLLRAAARELLVECGPRRVPALGQPRAPLVQLAQPRLVARPAPAAARLGETALRRAEEGAVGHVGGSERPAEVGEALC